MKELNYTYNVPLLFKDSLASKAKHIQEMKSILKCFELAAKQDTGKVLLVTLHTLNANLKYSNRNSWFGFKEVLKLYNLLVEETFVSKNRNGLKDKHFRIELVSNSNKRLCLTFNGNYKYHYSCIPPF